MTTRDRFVFGLVAIAAAVAAVWFLAIAPKRREAAGLGAQVTQAQARRDTANARATTVAQARSVYGRDYATIARLGKAVPPRGDVASLVFQLETAARAAGVDFRSVTVETRPATAPAAAGGDRGKETADGAGGASEASATTADVEPQPFTFSFEGTFAGLRNLLAVIDRFSRVDDDKLSVRGRLLTIDTVAMTAGRGGFPKVKADIVARAYVAALPPALAGAGSKTAGSSGTAR
jgi:hypothetical protein